MFNEHEGFSIILSPKDAYTPFILSKKKTPIFIKLLSKFEFLVRIHLSSTKKIIKFW